MMIGIGGADYSLQYRLQPIPLIIGPITSITDVSVQLYIRNSLVVQSSLHTVIIRAHSFPRQNLTNSAANLVNSVAHRGKADEILRLTAATQLNFRGLIKS